MRPTDGSPDGTPEEFLEYCKGLFWKKEGEDGFDPACDINKDGVIDVIDYTLIAQKEVIEEKERLEAQKKALMVGLAVFFLFILIVAFRGRK